MKYRCGTEVLLGDEIMVEHGPGQKSLARVVAIGLDQAVKDIDTRFYEWAKKERIIEATSVVVEWLGLGSNPLASNNPRGAPAGSYMTLTSLSSEDFVRRGACT